MFKRMKYIYNECIRSYDNDYNKNEYLINYIKNLNISESLNSNDGFTTLLANLHNNGINVLFQITPTQINDLPYKIPKIMTEYNSYLDFITEIEFSKKGLTHYDLFENENEYKKNLDSHNYTLKPIHYTNKENNEYNQEINNENVEEEEVRNSTIGSFNKKYPSINWKLYFEKRFEYYDINTSVTDEINLKNHAFYKVNNMVIPTEYIKLLNDYYYSTENNNDDDDDDDSYNRALFLEAKTEKHKHINIEIQYNKIGHMFKRSLYYTSGIIFNSLLNGSTYKEISNVIMINILNYNLFNDDKKSHWAFELREKETNRGEDARRKLLRLSKDKFFFSAYEQRKKDWSDIVSTKEENREEGVAEGRAEGMLINSIQSSIKMIIDNLDINYIVKYNYLSMAEVEIIKEFISNPHYRIEDFLKHFNIDEVDFIKICNDNGINIEERGIKKRKF
ncbi:hypothetical protein PIROE2DRAFT_14496 [Piromyces sp. E2]|nr:hypothetical protein PIROE2DRAFT_14496 [Piromyces sp. E2]|eukprot:OUM59864.1 hypothetical protein PIROE2DRAFT_14496 [Piromyces sp. E2]